MAAAELSLHRCNYISIVPYQIKAAEHAAAAFVVACLLTMICCMHVVPIPSSVILGPARRRNNIYLSCCSIFSAAQLPAGHLITSCMRRRRMRVGVNLEGEIRERGRKREGEEIERATDREGVGMWV